MPDVVKIYFFLCSSQWSYNNIFSEFYVTVQLSQKKKSFSCLVLVIKGGLLWLSDFIVIYLDN